MMKIKSVLILFYIFGLTISSFVNSSSSPSSSSSSSSSTGDNSNNLSPIQNYDFEFLNKHLTTKTPYWILTKDGDSNSQGDSGSGSGSESSSSSSNSIPLECKLVTIDFLARHGSRMPVQSSIDKLKEMTESISQYKEQVNNGFKWIFNYTVPYSSDIAGNLILQGQEEHYNISRRLLNKYPEFFEKLKYKPQSYGITSTAISRTGISASAFSFGLLQGTGYLGGNEIGFQPVFVQTSSLKQDNLLRFFSTCDLYTNEIKNASVINKNEQNKWNSLIYPNISIEISSRLGLSNIWEPTNNIVSDIFEACSYEISINNISNHWCSLLSKQNILDWEYSQDLSNYWIKSYGHKINYEIAKVLLKNVFDGFDQYVSGTTSSSDSGSDSDSNDGSNEEFIQPSPTAILRFGHAETVIPFITLLGLYKDDEKLYANSTSEQIENRKFRTSVVSPYASNIGMFLYDCGNNEFKIMVEHNELPVLIPGCDEIYCDYQQFKSIFPNISSFDFKSYCKIKSSSDSSSSTSDNSSDSDEDSKKHTPLFLAIFIPITFILGGTLGALFTYFGYDKINQFRNNKSLSNTFGGSDELIPSPNLKSSNNKSRDTSPLLVQ